MRLLRAAACLIAILGVLALHPLAAQASITTVVRSWNSGMCLDGNNSGDMYMHSCNGGANQSWVKSQDHSENWAEFRSVGNRNRCMESLGTARGNRVYSAGCNGSREQGWAETQRGWGADGAAVMVLRNLKTGLCLDSNKRTPGERNLYTDPCNGGNNQDWKMGF
jgi:ricin-type beta-trefoil lectin protein